MGSQKSTEDEVNWKKYGGNGKLVNVASRGAGIMHFGAAWPVGSRGEDIMMKIMDRVLDTWDDVIGRGILLV